jgi:hypothetical protein
MPTPIPASPQLTETDAAQPKLQPPEAIKPRPTPKTFPDYVARNYADWIGDDAILTSRMRWLPIAKRPALAVRWGVGVAMAQTTTHRSIRRPEELARLTAPIGPEVVRVLAQRLDEKRDGDWSDLPDPGLMKVPVFFAEMEDELVDDAALQNLDGLVLISISTQRMGLSKTMRITMVIRLVDVLAHKSTWSSAPLNNQKAQATRGTAEDASVLLVRSVFEKLDEQYGLKAVPELDEAVVEKRAARLAKVGAKPAETLRTLAELRYYQAGKLLKPDDAQRCYETLIGDKAAGMVAGTDAAARARAVEEWFQSRNGR